MLGNLDPQQWTLADTAGNTYADSHTFAGFSGAINASGVAVSNVAWQDITSAAVYCSASDALSIADAPS